MPKLENHLSLGLPLWEDITVSRHCGSAIVYPAYLIWLSSSQNKKHHFCTFLLKKPEGFVFRLFEIPAYSHPGAPTSDI